MKANALVCYQNQKFALEQVEMPDPAEDNIVIRTLRSGVSIGTEFALIQGKLSWGSYPICTGYQAIGEIEHVGSKFSGFAPGDKVFYRGTRPMKLPDGTEVSPQAGNHASHAVLDENTFRAIHHLPAGIDLDQACFFVMPAVGLFGVDMAKPKLGDNVVVYGTGLIGLGVVAALADRGCSITAVDINQKHLVIAEKFGADYLLNGSTCDVEKEIKNIAPDGADVVFECTGLPQCVDPAVSLCKRFGTFVWQGNYGQKPVSFDFIPAHQRRLTMYFPCDDGGPVCEKTVLKKMALGKLNWGETITHKVTPRGSVELYKKINTSSDHDVLGALINWEQG